MSRWALTIFLAALLAAQRPAAAREIRVADQKNLGSFTGLGTYSGVDSRGIPYGGIGAGMGVGGDTGRATSFGGFGGSIGTLPDSGPAGTGPYIRVTAGGFGGGTGGGTGAGVGSVIVPVGGFGSGPSGVVGGAAGSLPFP